MIPSLHQVTIGVTSDELNEDGLASILEQLQFSEYTTDARLEVSLLNKHQFAFKLTRDRRMEDANKPSGKFWNHTFTLGGPITRYRGYAPPTELLWSNMTRTIHTDNMNIQSQLMSMVAPYDLKTGERDPTLSKEIAAILQTQPLASYVNKNVEGHVYVTLEFEKTQSDDYWRTTDMYEANLRLSEIQVLVASRPSQTPLFVSANEGLLKDLTIALGRCEALHATWSYFAFNVYPGESETRWYPRSGAGSKVFQINVHNYNILPSAEHGYKAYVNVSTSSQGRRLKNTSKQNALTAFAPLLRDKRRDRSNMADNVDNADDADKRTHRQEERMLQETRDRELALLLTSQYQEAYEQELRDAEYARSMSRIE